MARNVLNVKETYRFCLTSQLFQKQLREILAKCDKLGDDMEMCEEIKVLFKVLKPKADGTLTLDERGFLMEKLTHSITEI